MNIYQKLIEVRKSVPYLKQDNKGYQFSYVSSSQALANVRNKMDEMQLLLVPSVKGNSVSEHATKNGGHEYFTQVEMIFTWINAENPEETICCDWIGQGLDSGEKGVGKALTYAEKYFMLKFFNIPTDKDDPDSFQDKAEKTKPKTVEWFIKASSANSASESALTAWWNKHLTEIKKLSQPDYDKLVTHCGEIKSKTTGPPTIKCPETGNEVTAEDCKQSRCRGTFNECSKA